MEQCNLIIRTDEASVGFRKQKNFLPQIWILSGLVVVTSVLKTAPQYLENKLTPEEEHTEDEPNTIKTYFIYTSKSTTVIISCALHTPLAT